MNPNPQKYKTMLCKHFSSPKGCSFGDKCQFAHGVNDLRTSNGLPISNPQIPNNTPQDKKVLTFRTIKSLNVNTGKKIITVGMVPYVPLPMEMKNCVQSQITCSQINLNWVQVFANASGHLSSEPIYNASRDGSGDDGNDDARRRWYCNEPNE